LLNRNLQTIELQLRYFSPSNSQDMKLLKTILNSAAILLLSTSFASADEYKNGSKINAFKAADQHGQAYEFEAAKTKYLLISFDMETGKKTNAALSAKGAEYLTGQKAVYIANIFGMPGIGRMFALPKMKKYPHRIILGDDANLLTPFPQQAGKVTVIKLSNGTVQSISYWDPATQQVSDVLK
jgi:hypothetical protein